MDNPIPLLGQWLGYYEYGPDYGERFEGQQVQFRIFVDAQQNGQFQGRCIDFDGFGANLLVAQIIGFVDGNVISFTKHYPSHFSTDDDGNCTIDESRPHSVINYQGIYDRTRNIIYGDWDIRTEVEYFFLMKRTYVVKGSWEMKNDD